MEAQRQKPLISVIVPVYNAEDTVEKCVRSILSQTYRELEIILIDDGSSDSSGEIIDRLAAQAPRIVVRHQKNGGSSSARNAGISLAHGKYIGFVDSDDFIDDGMYTLLFEAMDEAPVAQIGRDEIAADGSILPDICEPPDVKELVKSEDFMRDLLMHRGDCSLCTKLIKKEFLDAIYKKSGEYFPEGRLNEDFHLFIRMLTMTDKVVSLPKQAYHVYYSDESNSRKADKESFSRVFADSVENADMVQNIVREHFPGLKSKAFRFGVFQRLEYLLHIPVSQMTKDNVEYIEIVSWMRKRLLKALINPELTAKNKLYHIVLAIAPVSTRKLHRRLRGLA